MTQQNEAKTEIQKFWCQQCKSFQKSKGLIVECWYNPLTEEGELAFCANNSDAIDGIWDKIYKLGYRLIPELKPLTDEEMAKIKDCDLYDAIKVGEMDCKNCSGKCRAISQATIDKVKRELTNK